MILALAAALVSIVFALTILRQFIDRRRIYQLTWAGALGMFGAAALFEGLAGAWGWSPTGYRLYYLLGGILTVGWLGLGTVQLLFPGRLALAAFWVMALLSLSAIPAVVVAPVHAELLRQAEPGRGVIGGLAPVLAPVVNSLGSMALIGGAAWSAWIAWRHQAAARQVLGLALIATGALGAAATHGLAGQVAGYHALAPLGELVGAGAMFAGYLSISSVSIR
jgi:hypothetical protein